MNTFLAIFCIIVFHSVTIADDFNDLELISNEGLESMFHLNIGSIVAGEMSRPGLITEKGDTASSNHTGFGLDLKYYFTEFVGIAIESNFLFSSAVAPETKAMDFTQEWDNRLGLSVVPWQQTISSGLIKFQLEGGFNYTRFDFADEYKSFISSSQNIPENFLFSSEIATGFGYYTGFSFAIIRESGFTSEIGLRYLQQNPKYPNASKAINGHSILLNLALGYHFLESI